MTTETSRNGIAACGTKVTADKLAELLVAGGLNATAYPLINLAAEDFWSEVEDVASFDWLVLGSPAAASFALESAPANLAAKIAVIGQATAEAVADAGHSAELIPPEQSAAGLLQAIEELNLKPSRFLIPASALANDELRLGLELIGHEVTQLVAYYNVGNEAMMGRFSNDIEAGRLKAAAFTSASAVAYGNVALGLRDLRIYCIGTSTAAEVEGKGLRTYAVSDPQSVEALAELIIKSETNRE